MLEEASTLQVTMLAGVTILRSLLLYQDPLLHSRGSEVYSLSLSGVGDDGKRGEFVVLLHGHGDKPQPGRGARLGLLQPGGPPPHMVLPTDHLLLQDLQQLPCSTAVVHTAEMIQPLQEKSAMLF